jgi:hypothetical protein
MRVAQVFDIFGEVAEEEDVVLADFAGDFDLDTYISKNSNGIRPSETHISTIAGTNNQSTVQAELHVRGSGGFGTSSGDVLADVAGGADDLSLADIVVFQENDLQQVTNVLVAVDHFPDLVDEVNDRLRHPVSRSSLAAEYRHTGRELLPLFRGRLLDFEVAVDDTKDVELLALVLVHTLDLYIEESGRVDRNLVVLLDVFGEPLNGRV